MLYPIVKETKTYNLMTTEFGGYNHSLKPREGEFFDTENITTDYYPIASGRKKKRDCPQVEFALRYDGKG